MGRMLLKQAQRGMLGNRKEEIWIDSHEARNANLFAAFRKHSVEIKTFLG